MINYELANLALERQLNLTTNDNDRQLIKEFLYDKCHYFTATALSLLQKKRVVLFYLENSGRVIHSATEVDPQYIIDVLGERCKKEVESMYDGINSVTGIYESEGRCLPLNIDSGDFSPHTYYTATDIDLGQVQKKVHEWLVLRGILEFQCCNRTLGL